MPIHIKAGHKGRLHENLGIDKSKPISLDKLMQAKQSSSPAVRKQATFAVNARNWNK